jgi:hypothetical protein
MKKNKQKKCSGTGKAKGYGCGEIKFIHRYGLCGGCFYDWLYNSEPGRNLLEKTKIKAKRKVEKESRPKRKYVRWIDKSFKEMQQYVQTEIVNPYIRLRDIESFGKCISSGNKIHDAGHYYSVGAFPKLRYCCQNIHGQNASDNRFKGADLLNYQDGLRERFGDAYFEELMYDIKTDSINWPKLTKTDLIEIGKTYEMLTKKRIWCFRHEEFLNYMDIIKK